MHRPGMDEHNATAADFLCDFCEASWADDRPMVEGHRGSLICGKCLTLAFDALWNRGQGVPRPEAETCVMCLSPNDDPVWVSPVRDEARICKRCAKQSAVMLERDQDCGWKRPPVNA